MHAKAYNYVFGVDLRNEDRIVGSGFAVRNKQWRRVSNTFNKCEQTSYDNYHNSERAMSDNEWKHVYQACLNYSDSNGEKQDYYP